jgi:hypothetical protein
MQFVSAGEPFENLINRSVYTKELQFLITMFSITAVVTIQIEYECATNLIDASR